MSNPTVGHITPSPEQAAVLNAPVDADVLVVAGAGSGKTFTMTQRVIRLIDQGVPPERILGLTFTRKAASELLSRVSAVTSEGALAPTVSTYDAFFQSIVRQYGLLVGFDQHTQPLSEAGALQLASQVIDEHFDRLAGRDMGAFASLASQVIALSNAIGGSMIGGGCDSIDEGIERVRAWDHGFADCLNRAIGDEPVPESEPGKPRKPRGKKDIERRLAQWREAMFAYLHQVCLMRADDLRSVVVKRETLLDMVAAYNKAKRRLNMAEFSDFTIAAYQLVTRFDSIGEECRRRYSHVLLDEYQDTSTTQAMLLASLFHAGGSMADGQRSAVSAVGDPFQSIYAWRGASPGAFRMFQQDFGMIARGGAGGPGPRVAYAALDAHPGMAPTKTHLADPMALSVTRRNSRLILEAANNLTLPLRRSPRRPSSSLMHEVDVRPLSALPGKSDGTLGVLGYQTRGQEIDGVVRFVRYASRKWRNAALERARAQGVDDPGRAVGRAPRVAVLFRSKTAMPLYQAALEDAGLTVQTVGYSAMMDRPEVRDVMAILHVVADHTDSASLMRLLATPRYAVGAEDLAALAHIAEEMNTEYRFRALVEAVWADANAPRDMWDDVGREHRDKVAKAVFLPDMLLRDDLPSLLKRSGALSDGGSAAVGRAGMALRAVQRTVGRPIASSVHAAIEALDLDIDTVVAQAFADDGRSDQEDRGGQGGRDARSVARPSPSRASMSAIVDLVDTYMQEIPERQNATLSGFVAWVDSLGSLPEESHGAPDEAADVMLMSVHQSKGLEWDAVAVVGLSKGSFPTKQGDELKVEADASHPGQLDDSGNWTPPEYRESAHTWLSDPAAVPVPMRVDAGILPRFPHDAPVGADADPIAALAVLDDVESIDDEVFGSMRKEKGLADDDDAEAMGADALALTQCEEYGRRRHADERRLAYVALTRARYDALLTFSDSGSLSRDPSTAGSGGAPLKALDVDGKASNFWLEVRDSLARHAGVVRPEDVVDDTGVVAAVDATANPLPQSSPDLPVGYFVGDDANAFMQAVVGEAWRGPVSRDQLDNATLMWPGILSDRVADALDRSAAAVSSRLEAAERDPRLLSRPAPNDSLLTRAQLLCDDRDLMGELLEAGGSVPAERFDVAVRAKGMRVTAGSRQSVTAMQALSGHMTDREAREYWRGIVRPIPRVASPSAQAGTVFHAWAEQVLNAKLDPDHPDAPGVGPADDELGVWQRRLLESPWARRVPVWAERQIVVSVPELSGKIINGKLDAVFAGPLDPSAEQPGSAERPDSAERRYTVVDWKTGRRPRTQEEVRHKLAQLDLYRLLLSRVEDLPIGRIDAALYYVSESDPQRRLITAEPKTDREILSSFDKAIPPDSDLD